MRITQDRIDVEGRASRFSYAARPDGTPHPLVTAGLEGEIRMSLAAARVLVVELRQEGRILGRVERQLSKDGATLTAHQTLRDGSVAVLVYRRAD